MFDDSKSRKSGLTYDVLDSIKDWERRLPGLAWGTNPEDDTKGAHAAPSSWSRRCQRSELSVVAIRENRRWHRGIITDGDGTIAISLWDWGRNVERRLFEVHILEDRFCLKWQGIPCGLAHSFLRLILAKEGKGPDQILHKSIRGTDVHFGNHKKWSCVN